MKDSIKRPLFLIAYFVIEISASVDQPPMISKFINVDEDNVYVINPDDPFQLECTARAHPSPEFSWFKDNKEITTSLEIPEVFLRNGVLEFSEPNAAEHKGHYHCEAKNKLGRAKSDVVFVTDERPTHPEWAVKPKFKETPEVEIQEVGKDAEFHCSTSEGDPEPLIVWTKDGVVVKQDPGDDPRMLRIEDVGQDDIGTYACNASNIAGYAYKMVYLNILTQSPIITEPPRNQTVSIEQKAVLRCSVKGYPKPKLIWLFDGEELSNGDYHDISAKGELTLKNIRVKDKGRYICVAENKHGEERVSSYLNVVEKTTITEGPSDRSRQIGQNITMKCSVVWNPNLELEVSWKKDNLDIVENERISVNSENELLISDLRFEDSGAYTCVAMTSTGSSTDTGTLTVSGIPPSLVAGPNDLITIEGVTVRILCTVNGYPKPEHIWYGDTDRINPEDDERYDIDDEGALTIREVTRQDSKKYVCRASNGYGEPVVESAFIDIRRKTVLAVGPQHARFTSGEPATLDCYPDVDPALRESLKVEWYKEDELLNPDEHDNIILFPNSSLHIDEMRDENIGKYTCRVHTGVDEVIGVARIYHEAIIDWIIILIIVILSILLLILLLFCILCCRRRNKRKGRYGVKDIEEGKKSGNKSDICYSVDDEDDGVGENDPVTKEELEGETNAPIFTPRTLKSDYPDNADSMNSLLNITEEEAWLKRGMDEDGSFREGKYAVNE